MRGCAQEKTMPPIRGRQAKSSAKNATGTRANTVGFEEKNLDALLDSLDKKSSSQPTNVKRTFARWPFRMGSIKLALEHPGGSRVELTVACRNLSRGGTGVLHSAYVHTDTPCVIYLPKPDGSLVKRRGKIVRCSHVKGLIHELGILFDEPIHLSNFVTLDPFLGGSSFENIDPGELLGTALALVSSDIDKRIIEHFLSDTQLKLRFAQETDDAVKQATDNCDVILLDLMMENAIDTLEAIRKQGVNAPVVALGEEANSDIRNILEKHNITMFVLKPLNNDLLLSALAECLLVHAGEDIMSEAVSGVSPAILNNCLDLTRSLAGELRQAFGEEDAMKCFAFCQQIRGAALQLGLEQVIAVADKAATNVAASMSTSEAAADIEEVINLCERLKMPSRKIA